MPGRLELRRWIELHHTAYAIGQSEDGQYVAVGAETGAFIYNLSGHRLAAYPVTGDAEAPVHQLCAMPDFSQIALATRLGTVILLNITPTAGRLEVVARQLPGLTPDIHTLAFSATEDRIALGHLSYTLTMLNEDGDTVWQQQDEGAAALGAIWSVALDPGGTKLYTGSTGSGVNWLTALDAGTGALLYKRQCDVPVTGVTALADRLGVAVISPGEYDTAWLTAYTPDLEDVLWEQILEGPATAITADAIEPVVAVGAGYEGVVTLLNAENGATLATEPMRALVNDLSLARGRFVAVATQDGHIGLLRYLP
jgi:outer membrane protein assembly factor BamB